MDISAPAYRILKYLKKNKSDEVIRPSLVIKYTGCETREEFNDALQSLADKGLIEETKADVSITPAGIDYFIKLEHQNEDLAYEDVFENFDYSVLKYLYVNDWGVRIKEFPDVIMKEVPNKKTVYDDSNLINYLYSKKQYIDKINYCYKLNKEGIRYYKFLTDKKIAEKEAKKESSKTVYQIEKVEQHGSNFIGGEKNTNTTNTTDSNNITTTEQKPTNKKWYMVVRDEALKVSVTALIAFGIGLFTGKSCNQNPLQNQIQNSTHDSLQNKGGMQSKLLLKSN